MEDMVDTEIREKLKWEKLKVGVKEGERERVEG